MIPQPGIGAFLGALALLGVSVIGGLDGIRFIRGDTPRTLRIYGQVALPSVYRNTTFVYGPVSALWTPGWLAMTAALAPFLGPLDTPRAVVVILAFGWILVVSGLAFRWAYRPRSSFYPPWFAAVERDLAIPRPIPDRFDKAVLVLGTGIVALGLSVLALGVLVTAALIVEGP